MLLCRRDVVNDADTEFERDEEQEAFLSGDETSVVVVEVIPVMFVGDEDDDGRSEETKETTDSSCKSSVRGGGDVFGRGGGIGGGGGCSLGLSILLPLLQPVTPVTEEGRLLLLAEDA